MGATARRSSFPSLPRRDIVTVRPALFLTPVSSWRRRSIAAHVCLAGVVALAASGSPAAQQPKFGARVDVVVVDVNVVDGRGRPIEGLKEADFSLTVDGKARRVTSVSFVRDAPVAAAGAPAGSAAASPEKAAAAFSSNEGSQAGRLIVLVVDQDNIRSGGGRNAMESAARFLDQLQPADRVGLIALPAGPSVEITADHEKVRAALRRVTGRESSLNLGRNVGLSEALGIEAGERDALARAVDRECEGLTDRQREACEVEVETTGRTLAADTRRRTRASLDAIRQVLAHLAGIEGPKILILISESLVTGAAAGDLSEAAGRFEEIAAECARAQVTMFALHLERSLVDASAGGMPPTAALDRQLRADGLRSLASFTRGTLFDVVGSAAAPFDRIRLELSGHYLLGFEAEANDRDGRPHRIEVTTARRDVEVRARREFVFAAPGAETDEKALVRTLTAPFVATDIPLRVTSYAMRHPENSKVRLVISAEIGRNVEAPQQMSIAFAVYDSRGKPVSNALQRVSLAPKRVPGPVPYVASVSVEPGDYTLRLAVRDGSGRTGSVEHKAHARLVEAPPMQTSDLMLADEDPSQPGKWQPSVGGQAAGEMSAFLELYCADNRALGNANVRFEVAEAESGPALVAGEARAAGPPEKGRRAVTARVSLDLLPPGPYVARAVIIGDREIGRVARPFVVSPPDDRAAAGPPPVRVVPFSDLAHAFDRRQVLEPRVVGPFLDRFTATGAPPPSAPVQAAIAKAKQSTFDGSFDRLRTGSDVAATFLHGLALLSRNDLEGAAGDFRAALRLSSDFFPAAFYLGACYAAGGRGREAVGAWQTTLAGDSSLQIAYLMSFDALARLGDWPQALDVAQDGLAQWPDEAGFERRVIAASTMTGADAEALQALRAYLGRHPGDQEALFLAMRLILRGRAVGHADGDGGEVAEFGRYAQLYAKANGPRQPLVSLWQRRLAGQ